MSIRLDHLRIKQLHFIDLLAGLGSLAATAERLSMSPSAASMMLREIEGIFGVKLFERKGRGMSLTAQGQNLLPRCRTVLGEVGAMGHTIRDAGAPLLKMGAFPHTTTTVLPQLVQALITGPVPWRLQLRSESAENLMQLLLAGDMDVMLGQLPVSAAGAASLDELDQRVLYQSPLSVVASREHPLAGRRKLDLAELLAWPWVLPGMQSTTRTALVDAFLRQGLSPPKPTIESPSFFYSLSLVAHTQLLTCCARSAALLSSHPTTTLAVTIGLDPRPVSLIWRRQNAQAVQAMRNLEGVRLACPGGGAPVIL